MHKYIIRYKEAENYIQDRDILLFRGRGLLSLLIQVVSEGSYSHVAMASWAKNGKGENVYLECVEFREWIGSRVVNLENYVKQNPGIIDVFRPSPTTITYQYNCKMRTVDIVTKQYNPEPILNEFTTLTGLPYGWKRIWWIAKHHIIGLRLFFPTESLDDEPTKDDIYPVCSTIISHLFSKYYVDLIKFRSDARMEPNDLATRCNPTLIPIRDIQTQASR